MRRDLDGGVAVGDDPARVPGHGELVGFFFLLLFSFFFFFTFLLSRESLEVESERERKKKKKSSFPDLSRHQTPTTSNPLLQLTPVVTGVLFGTRALAGVLAGALVSGVQMAISMSNTGGAWDNAKKYVEAGASEHAASLGGKGSDAHKAAVIGDTVGDPLKDTSGPSLNILIKLMAVESLVFAPFFKAHTPDGIIGKLFG